ncbi:hypothetical protein K438DRAFT_2024113 [Mycena galopus ATCC 62051]|nr:hypothetical protein K438DRAFT_2024113 [Mycena galopus ATCC 62051]
MRTLGDDIVDRILTFCPTFSTLQATVLTCKTFYRVFQTHPKSITHAVTCHVVGPAVSQALRVVRYPYPDRLEDSPPHSLDPIEMASACSEDFVANIITTEEKAQLLENSKVVAELEDIYSLTNKDRTSKKSVLTSEESFRFRRAAYRIMLYCKLFPGDPQRTAVLNEYPTDELLQLASVVKFMRSIFEYYTREDRALEHPDSTGLVDVLLPAGMAAVWGARTYDYLVSGDLVGASDEEAILALFTGYFALPLQNVWEARQFAPPTEDEPASTGVLDEVRGVHDTCVSCGAPGGLTLFTEANWAHLALFSSSLLNGNLKNNRTLHEPFFTLLPDYSNRELFGSWMAGLFAPELRAKEFKNAAWDLDEVREEGGGWCEACFWGFLEAHAWMWFLRERVKAGWVPPEDCGDGWLCTAQVYNTTHAEEKNHMCEPARGEES